VPFLEAITGVQRPPPMKMSGAVPPARPVVIFWKELAQSV
jgi:hypothetical protein